MRHLVLAAVLVAVHLAATALPFLPGRYDTFAVDLAVLARALGSSAVLLAPVGFAWLVRESLLPREEVRERGAGFAFATLAAGSLGALVTAVVCFGLSGVALGLLALATWGLVLWRGARGFVRWARGPRRRELGPACAIALAPCALAGGQYALAGPLTSCAWNRTMDGMAPLIADIEQYRAARGHYPRSLFAEWTDYRPDLIGVRGYLYEPRDDAYRLAVEVPTFTFGARVFLSYDPADEHVMTGHDSDLLLRTEEDLPLYRGYAFASDAGRPHWKALLFD